MRTGLIRFRFAVSVSFADENTLPRRGAIELSPRRHKLTSSERVPKWGETSNIKIKYTPSRSVHA